MNKETHTADILCERGKEKEKEREREREGGQEQE